MWVKAKEDKWRESRVYKIIGATTSDTYLYGIVGDGATMKVVLGEYASKDDINKAFNRIMTAIVNKGSLVDLSKEF